MLQHIFCLTSAMVLEHYGWRRRYAAGACVLAFIVLRQRLSPLLVYRCHHNSLPHRGGCHALRTLAARRRGTLLRNTYHKRRLSARLFTPPTLASSCRCVVYLRLYHIAVSAAGADVTSCCTLSLRDARPDRRVVFASHRAATRTFSCGEAGTPPVSPFWRLRGGGHAPPFLPLCPAAASVLLSLRCRAAYFYASPTRRPAHATCLRARCMTHDLPDVVACLATSGGRGLVERWQRPTIAPSRTLPLLATPAGNWPRGGGTSPKRAPYYGRPRPASRAGWRWLHCLSLLLPPTYQYLYMAPGNARASRTIRLYHACFSAGRRVRHTHSRVAAQTCGRAGLYSARQMRFI